MQKLTKTFTSQHGKICKSSLQKSASKSMKANSESLSVNLMTYWKLFNHLHMLNSFGWCVVGTLSKKERVKHDSKSIFKFLEENSSQPGRKFTAKTL